MNERIDATVEMVVQADSRPLVQCSISSPNVDAEKGEWLRMALETLELGALLDQQETESCAHRIECMQQLFSRLRTALTTEGDPYEMSAQQSVPGDG